MQPLWECHRNNMAFTGNFLRKVCISKNNLHFLSLQVAELQKLAGQVKDLIATQVTNSEKVVNGKMSKQQYLDLDKTTTARRTELLGKLEVTTHTL